MEKRGHGDAEVHRRLDLRQRDMERKAWTRHRRVSVSPLPRVRSSASPLSVSPRLFRRGWLWKCNWIILFLLKPAPF